jgi:two-component system phosphate regulon sensor histidine kinase PhoR
MILRVLAPALAAATGAAGGWWAASPGWTLVGAVLGVLAWSVSDGVMAARVVRWLTAPERSEVPALPGEWGQVVDLVYRRLRKLEKKARKSRARLDDFLSALQASPIGVVLLDEAWRIEWANPVAASHLGFDPQRDLGLCVRDQVRHPDFLAYLDEGDPGQEIEIDGDAGTAMQPTRVSVQVFPYGRKRHLLVSRDVTALHRADAMRRHFVANVSHEIRTPLTVLAGFVETMQTLPLQEEERRRHLALMAQQARRMQTLVDDLLTLSRLEGSPSPGMGEWTDVQELLEHVLQEARGLSQATAAPPHDVGCGEDHEAFEIAGVRSELLSAMSNLLSNAVRYTPPGGRIRAAWRRRDDGSAEFYVLDTGPGIAAEHLPRLSERFYRVDRSRSRETGGTGLGLAIVKHVVQRHGGRLEVHSEQGRGSRFMLVFPASRVRR